MKKKIKYLLIIVTLLFLTTGCTTYLKDNEGKAITNEKTGQNLVENILCRPEDEETIKLYEESGFDLTNLPYCVCNEDKVKEKVDEEINDVETKDTNKTEKDTKKEESKETKKSEDKNDTKAEETKTEANEETKEKEEETETDSCEELSVTGKYEGLWTSFFVRPLAWIILFFGKLTGKFGLGLIITSILIRLAMYPLTKKTAIQTEKMKEIQPEMNQIEKKYANKDLNDRTVMMQKSQEMMMLYKKHNVSPMSGCLPAFLQLPLLMAFLDAINRVPAIFEENFLGFHLGTTPKIGITNGNWVYIVLTILVAVTTFFSLVKAQNSNTNDQTAKQTKTMMNAFTIMIIVMSVFMSSALNIYWIISNAFTLLQNILVKRSMK